MKTNHYGWLALLCSLPLNAAEPQVFFGNLHSHTHFSDGSGTPSEAFRFARDTAKLDFLAITEHNHREAEDGLKTSDPRKDGVLIATAPALYNGAQRGSLISAATSLNKDSKFVAIYGQEFSSISKGNHVNVFEVGEVIDDQVVRSGDFKALVAWLTTHLDSQQQPAIVQFNHPDKDLRDKSIEYGMDDFGNPPPDLAQWIRQMGRHARLIEVFNGPGTREGTDLRPEQFQSDYLHYLNLGFKLAPTGDQDNHFRNWGKLTQVRTGVIAESLTKANILQAMRQRHVYATMDSNLRLLFFVEGHLCGDIIQTLPTADAELKIEYSIEDVDEPGASYEIEVYSDKIGGGRAQLNHPIEIVEVEANNPPRQMRRIEDVPFLGEGQYVVFRVVQKDEDGQHDLAWTAPVWFEKARGPGEEQPLPHLVAGVRPEEGAFVAGKGSSLYHVSLECRIAKGIKLTNRVTGTSAKIGRTLHQDCPLKDN